eukprot:307062-Prorocentrum_minimum.AAC.1
MTLQGGLQRGYRGATEGLQRGYRGATEGSNNGAGGGGGALTCGPHDGGAVARDGDALGQRLVRGAVVEERPASFHAPCRHPPGGPARQHPGLQGHRVHRPPLRRQPPGPAGGGGFIGQV